MAPTHESQPKTSDRERSPSSASAARPSPSAADELQGAFANSAPRRPALSGVALMRLQRTAGNRAVQRLLYPSPSAGMITDPNTPAGGGRDEPGVQREVANVDSRQSAQRLWAAFDAKRAAQGSGIGTGNLQRKIDGKHDLKSARLKGDPVLEAVFDNERLLKNHDSGPAVIKVQHALTDLGFRMTKFGIDGNFGPVTTGQVKAFQASAGLTADGIVGPKTIGELDNQLLSGKGGPGPLPSPAPAPGTAVAPTLAAVINTGPTPGINGNMNFVINWQLGGNAGPKGGFIIQDVLFVWRTRDAKGKDVPNPDARTSPLHYFEAWQVAPKSKTLTPVTTDTFFWPNAAPWAGNNSKGRVTIVGTAHFFDDVPALPAHMVANNKATFAGGLQSSLTDPALKANVSGPVAHSLAFHWDSTKKNNQPTVLDADTP